MSCQGSFFAAAELHGLRHDGAADVVMIEMAPVVAVQNEWPMRCTAPCGEFRLGDPGVACAVERHDGDRQPRLVQRRNAFDGRRVSPDEVKIMTPPMRPLP